MGVIFTGIKPYTTKTITGIKPYTTNKAEFGPGIKPYTANKAEYGLPQHQNWLL
jgi:hypothetical protein